MDRCDRPSPVRGSPQVAKMGTIMVMQVQELRRKAALCRRAASIPTSGSGNAERILLTLAEQLERDAVLREHELRDDSSGRLLDTGRTAAARGAEVRLAGHGLRSRIGR